MNIKSYRPISLFNDDYKIYARVLAERLKKYFLDYVNKELTGFFKSRRQLKDNLRCVNYVIEYYDKNPGKEVSFFFLET